MKVLLAGGGTGGHINPALAIANEIKKNNKDAEILFAGTPFGMEATLIPRAGYNFAPIKVAGIQRKLTPYNIYRNIKALWYLLFAGMRAKKIIKGFSPDIVIGTGGYVSGPIVRTAAKMGIKTAIHEQNAFPGVTTKLLSKDVNVVMLAFEKAKEYLPENANWIVTGNPVREEIILKRKEDSKKALNLDDKPCVLSFGGSLGAETINRLAAEIIEWDNKEESFNFIHATGKYGVDFVPELLKAKGIDHKKLSDSIRVTEYIHNMDECMSAADLVISRAGAITLSELMAAGKGAILIPSPNVAENHQYHNAMELQNKGAAYVFEEKNINFGEIKAKIEELIKSPEKLKELSTNASKGAIVDANQRIYKIISDLLKN